MPAWTILRAGSNITAVRLDPTRWLLRRRLKARSPAVRRRAVAELRARADADAVELLIEVLADAEPAVRAEAVAALAECRDERVLNALLGALRDADASVRLAAIAALQKLNDPAAVPPLVSLLLRGNPDEKWRAARALDAFHWRPQTETEEIEFSLALGEIARVSVFGAAAIKPLTDLLRHASYEKRVAAVNALGEINDPAVLRPLQQALRDADPLVRTAAAHALGRLGDPQAVPALLQALKDRETNARAAAAAALGRLGDARAVEPLIQLLNDPQWEVRAAALEALGKLGDPRALQPVAARLDDKDQEVRQYAADAVARVGDESVIEKLVLTLVDPHGGVRQAAARALTRLDPNWERSERVKKLLPKLEAAAHSRDAAVQSAASNLIKRISGRAEDDTVALVGDAAERRRRATLRLLRELARHADPLARLAAVQALARLGAPSAREAEQLAAADPHEWVRAALVSPSRTPALAPTAPQITSLLLCGERGEVLLEWQCAEADGWARFLTWVTGRAPELAPGAALNEFVRLEVVGARERRVCWIGLPGAALISTRLAEAGGPNVPPSPATDTSPLTRAAKETLTEWLRRAPSCPGALVRAVWFPDQTITCDVDARDFSAAALEEAARTSAEGFQLLRNVADAPRRLSWFYQRAVLHGIARDEGSVLLVVTTTRLSERELAGVDALGAEFRALRPNPAGEPPTP
ncbi:MAG: HEAT repeat domain-containing protein [Verrucomicrobiae bacterium]|nr:HEAT repeat domain-containing protein [Verrucomicrobiae bacterium]